MSVLFALSDSLHVLKFDINASFDILLCQSELKLIEMIDFSCRR